MWKQENVNWESDINQTDWVDEQILEIMNKD